MLSLMFCKIFSQENLAMDEVQITKTKGAFLMENPYGAVVDHNNKTTSTDINVTSNDDSSSHDQGGPSEEIIDVISETESNCTEEHSLNETDKKLAGSLLTNELDLSTLSSDEEQEIYFEVVMRATKYKIKAQNDILELQPDIDTVNESEPDILHDFWTVMKIDYILVTFFH
uniref:Uncharacterized protein n=1 Tax=Clytia hemisphaerica TaxID=252671 RepID=A0A7M5X841_9CNID